MNEKNVNVFYALLRAGLWETDVRLSLYSEIDYEALLGLADEQSVLGLIAAGIEHVTDKKPQKKEVLQFIGRVTQLEQRNQAMNYFIAILVEKMREAGIYTLLVKGQGIAQCYEKPLWRTSGDVDFFLSCDNYDKAKSLLTPIATRIDDEKSSINHLAMHIGNWDVELHGSLRGSLWRDVNTGLDYIQNEIFSFSLQFHHYHFHYYLHFHYHFHYLQFFL